MEGGRSVCKGAAIRGTKALNGVNFSVKGLLRAISTHAQRRAPKNTLNIKRHACRRPSCWLACYRPARRERVRPALWPEHCESLAPV